MFSGRLDDRVQAAIIVDEHGRCESGVEAQQRAMRSIGIEAEERQRVIDQILRKQARDQGFADTALLSSEQVNIRHGNPSLKYALTYHRAASADGTSRRHFRYTDESNT